MKADRGAEAWNRFVAGGVAESRKLLDRLGAIGLAELEREEARAGLRDAAHRALSISSEAHLMGVEPVGRLALAVERVLENVLAGEVAGERALPYAASACHTLAQAFEALANPDKPGARVGALPLEAARHELETLLPGPGGTRKPAVAADVPVAALLRSRAPDPE